MTTLEPNEIVTGVRVPDPGPRAGGTYLKLERKVGDFATVGVAVHVSLADGGTVERAGIALTGVGPTNLRARAAEDALQGRALDDEAIGEAARLAAEAAAAVRRPPRHRRVQAEHGARLHRARAAQGGGRGGGRLMADQRCPNCGEPLPEELGQHALTPTSGLVRCPSCGETVTLERADEDTGDTGATRDTAADAGMSDTVVDEEFAGEETIPGVMDELREKEGGPQ